MVRWRPRCMLDLSHLALLKMQMTAAQRWPKPRSGWQALWVNLRSLFR